MSKVRRGMEWKRKVMRREKKKIREIRTRGRERRKEWEEKRNKTKGSGEIRMRSMRGRGNEKQDM